MSITTINSQPNDKRVIRSLFRLWIWHHLRSKWLQKNICSLNNGYTNIIILHLLKSLSICVNVVILVCNRVILVFRFPWHRIFKFCVDISNRFVPTWLIYYDVRVIFIFSRKIVSWFRVDIEVNIQNCWNGGNHYKNSQWNL